MVRPSFQTLATSSLHVFNWWVCLESKWDSPAFLRIHVSHKRHLLDDSFYARTIRQLHKFLQVISSPPPQHDHWGTKNIRDYFPAVLSVPSSSSFPFPPKNLLPWWHLRSFVRRKERKALFSDVHEGGKEGAPDLFLSKEREGIGWANSGRLLFRKSRREGRRDPSLWSYQRLSLCPMQEEVVRFKYSTVI